MAFQVKQMAQELGAPVDKVLDLYKAAHEILERHGYSAENEDIRFWPPKYMNEDGEAIHIWCRIYVKAEPRTLAKLEAELADTLAERDLIPSAAQYICASYATGPSY